MDIAVYLDETADATEARLEVLRVLGSHLGTDEIDLVVLNRAPTALVGRILGTRQVILDRDPFGRHRFQSLALRQFLDFRIVEQRLLSGDSGVVDRDLILRKLADLDLYLAQVSEYRGLTADAYRRDWKVQRIVERTLQMAIEACVDVAAHVIADRGLRVPATSAEAFEVLGEAGLRDPGLTVRMVRMAGFRNVLVHEYARVDAEIVVGILADRLDDLARFRASALAWE